MTPKAALAKWQPRLRLADWRLAFSDLEPDEDSRSNIDLDVRIRSGVIRLRSDMPPSQIERQVVHELLHVLMSGMEDTYRSCKEFTPKAWDSAGDTMWNRAEEFAIEALVDELTEVPRTDWGPAGDIWNGAFPEQIGKVDA
jgi:hypothetical protein